MEDEIEKLYYSTSDIAKILQVSVFDVNYWLKSFKIPYNQPVYYKVIQKKYLDDLTEICRLIAKEELQMKAAKRKFKEWKDARRIKNTKDASGVGEQSDGPGTVPASSLERYLYPDENSLSGGD